MYTGYSFNPTNSTSVSNSIGAPTLAPTERPNRLRNGNLSNDQRTIDRWFDITAFTALPNNIGRFGNSPRNVIEGPSSKVVHLSLAKLFRISGRSNLQLQVNALNVFNVENLDLNTAGLNMTETNKNPVTGSAGKLLVVRDGIERFGPRAINVEARFSF
jgi:hypothetical protein